MNPLVLPWNVLICLILLLLFLLAREAVLTFRLHKSHPEKGMAWFNAAVLIILFLGVFSGGLLLILREYRLAQIVPLYPNARYAPERELVSVGKNWIFVTHDSSGMVESFYGDMASSSGYTLMSSKEHAVTRLLFQKENKNFFLTIASLEDTRYLFYGDDGEVTVLQKTAK